MICGHWRDGKYGDGRVVKASDRGLGRTPLLSCAIPNKARELSGRQIPRRLCAEVTDPAALEKALAGCHERVRRHRPQPAA